MSLHVENYMFHKRHCTINAALSELHIGDIKYDVTFQTLQHIHT